MPTRRGLVPAGHFDRPLFLRACPIYNGVGAHLVPARCGRNAAALGLRKPTPRRQHLSCRRGVVLWGHAGGSAQRRERLRHARCRGVGQGAAGWTRCSGRPPRCRAVRGAVPEVRRGAVGRPVPFSVCRRACPFCRGRPFWVRALRPGLRVPSRSGRGLRERGPRRAQLLREPAPPSPGGRSGS